MRVRLNVASGPFATPAHVERVQTHNNDLRTAPNTRLAASSPSTSATSITKASTSWSASATSRRTSSSIAKPACKKSERQQVKLSLKYLGLLAKPCRISMRLTTPTTAPTAPASSIREASSSTTSAASVAETSPTTPAAIHGVCVLETSEKVTLSSEDHVTRSWQLQRSW